MAFTLSSLTAYTDEQAEKTRVASVAGARTISDGLVTLLPNVKSSRALNIAATAYTIAAADSCGFSAAGNDTYTQRVLTVTDMKINKEWCPNDLEDYWMQLTLSNGSYYDEGVSEIQLLMDDISEKIAYDNDVHIWQGNAGLSMDGFVDVLDAVSGTTTLTSTGVTWSQANSVNIIQTMFEDIPEAVVGKEDLRIFMGTDYARTLYNQLRDENLFNFAPGDDWRSYMFPGLPVRIEVVEGLTSSNRIIAARTSNLFVGMDAEGDPNDFKLWFSDDNDTVRLKMRWKIGVQVAHPADITVYQGS